MTEDGEPVHVEATGETVGEAKWQALRELERRHPGVDREAVAFEVLSEGERGLLGVGYAPARVVASAPPAALRVTSADDAGGLAAAMRELVHEVVFALGVECRVEVVETDDEVAVSCSGGELGVLIGRHGHTIDALQYLANAIAAREEAPARKDVVVDAAGYRARRRATLEALALEAAERARERDEEVVLEPMSPVERKIVHTRLHDVAGVSTRSDGNEPSRYVVVVPAADAAEPPSAGD